MSATEPISVKKALARLCLGKDLDLEQAHYIFTLIMSGGATPAQIGGLLTALRLKGESIEEVAGAARAMRDLSLSVSIDLPHLVDTCGTGGSGPEKLFNISTAAAFVAAAAGAHVAKHGNRAASSKSGSADVLEAAGVEIDLNPQQIEQCIREAGVGFMFAPAHHTALRQAAGARRELGFRTIFNLVGPLTNPASAPNQVIGVFAPQFQRTLAEVLLTLGSKRVLVVHADGLDELSSAGPSHVVELKEGELIEYTIRPEQFGLVKTDLNTLKAESAEASLALIQGALSGEQPQARDIVALNAGAAIYVAGVTPSLETGVACAQETIASGSATQRLQEFIDLTRALGGA